MPHCIIEHSKNIDGELLVEKVFSSVLESKLFESDGSDIKVRSLSFDSFITGSKKSDFIHVALKILSGRTADQKSRLSHAVADNLSNIDYSNISITIEVIDIERESYCKILKE